MKNKSNKKFSSYYDACSINNKRQQPVMNHSNPYVQEAQKTQQSIYETQFNFEPKKIFHLWLVQILPGSSFLNLKYDFSQKKIYGQKSACNKKIKQCNRFVQTHKMKLVSDFLLQDNHLCLLEKKIVYNIYNREIIKAAYQDLTKNYKFLKLKDDLQKLISKKNIYLVSIQSQDDSEFTKWWQKVSKSPRITRQDIRKAQEQGKKRKQYVYRKQSSSLQQSDQQNSIQEQQDSWQQSQNKEDSIEINQTDEQCQQNQQNNKNENDQQKNLIQQTGHKYNENSLKFQFNKYSFDLPKFKQWIEMHKNLQIKQFKFYVIKNKLNIVLNPQNNVQKKRNTVYFYLCNEKILLIKDQFHYLLPNIQKTFCTNSKKTLQCKMIKGYVKQNSTEQDIRKLYLKHKLSEKRTKINSEYVVAVLIKGVKPDVDNCIIKIKQMLKQNQRQNVMLDLPDIQPYLNEIKVKKFMQTIVKDIIKKYEYLQLLDIICPGTKVTLSLQINASNYDIFKNQQQTKIRQQILNSIYFQRNIFAFQNLTQQLKDKYLLFQSKQQQDQVVFISNAKQAATLTKKILQTVYKNQMQCDTKCIQIKKTRQPMIKQFIDDLKKNNQQIKNCNFTYHHLQFQTKIQIFGRKKNLNQIFKLISQYLYKLNAQMRQKNFTISQFELNLLNQNLQKYKKQLGQHLPFIIRKNINIGALLTLGPSPFVNIDDPISIYIYKQRNPSCLPKQTTFLLLSAKDLDYLIEQQFQDVANSFKINKNSNSIGTYHSLANEKLYKYIYYNQSKSVTVDLLQLMINFTKNVDQVNNYAFFMPSNQKGHFLQTILKCFYTFHKNKPSKIFIFDNSSQNIQNNMQNILKISQQSKNNDKMQKKLIYYINDTQQLYYSKSGNQKIEQALKNGSKKVYLSNVDLNLKQATHFCSLKKQKMIHISSKKQIDLLIYPDKIAFNLNGIQFQMPQQQILKVQKQKKQQWVNISIGVYEIDFINDMQTNLFSGFKRNLLKKYVEHQKPFGEWKLNLNFDYKINDISIQYKVGNQYEAQKLFQKLKSIIKKQKIQNKYTLSKILQNDEYQVLKQQGQQLNIEITWDGKKQLTLIGLEKITIDFFKKHIDKQFSEKQQTFKFPQNWIKQNNQINEFIVPTNSQQFIQVQNKFKIFPIKQLVRIQNKMVYKKYHNQKLFLSQINGGKAVKQMMLYHGTSNTDPRYIYEDKQQCFNINYTSDQNLFGRGAYFAQQSIYSQKYQYNDKQSGRRSMLYCSVLVGDSQLVEQYNSKIIDTDYKDSINKIKYESITHKFKNSQIYVVYKSMRAYPHYLIKY